MKTVIFGCGKIARGFIAQLLYRSGFHITFVEIDDSLVKRLNKRWRYYVNVMGHAENSEWIRNYTCVSLLDTAGIAEVLKDADIAFTSVGGKNLSSLARKIAEAYQIVVDSKQEHTFTIVTCENWKDPARQLYSEILSLLPEQRYKQSFEDNIGVTEAVIMRSGVEATKEVLDIDENAVSVTNYWELPIDKSRMKGELVSFTGVEYRDNFAGFLQQKVFTFNTTNATISYLGRLRKIEVLSEAANDPQIVELVRDVHSEINAGISKEMHIPLKEQVAFSQKALKKYQDKSVVDFTERHARDPIRKIGPNDRIVGTLRLIERQNIPCTALATTLAAALFYPDTNPDDPSSTQLKQLREKEGIDYILKNICKIDPDEELAKIVKQRISWLEKLGWLHE